VDGVSSTGQGFLKPCPIDHAVNPVSSSTSDMREPRRACTSRQLRRRAAALDNCPVRVVVPRIEETKKCGDVEPVRPAATRLAAAAARRCLCRPLVRPCQCPPPPRGQRLPVPSPAPPLSPARRRRCLPPVPPAAAACCPPPLPAAATPLSPANRRRCLLPVPAACCCLCHPRPPLHVACATRWSTPAGAAWSNPCTGTTPGLSEGADADAVPIGCEQVPS